MDFGFRIFDFRFGADIKLCLTAKDAKFYRVPILAPRPWERGWGEVKHRRGGWGVKQMDFGFRISDFGFLISDLGLI